MPKNNINKITPEIECVIKPNPLYIKNNDNNLKVFNVFDLDKYINCHTFADETIDKYRRYICYFDTYLATLGRVDINDIQPSDLRNWIQVEHASWSPRTKRIAYISVKLYLKWFFGNGEVPCLDWKPPRSTAYRKRRSLNEQQVSSLFSILNGNTAKGVRDIAMISLMLDTGLRVSEVCRLKAKDVDLITGELAVVIKGNHAETAVFSELTANRIKNWMAYRKKIVKPNVVELFVGVGGLTPGKTMTRNGIKKIFRDLGVLSGIGKFAPHDLRRTFATLSIMHGAPTRLVQIGGRWKSISMVELYTQDLQLTAFKVYLPMKHIASETYKEPTTE